MITLSIIVNEKREELKLKKIVKMVNICTVMMLKSTCNMSGPVWSTLELKPRKCFFFLHKHDCIMFPLLFLEL